MPLPNKMEARTERTPRGSVVFLGPRLLTDELRHEDADALAASLNKGTADNADNLERC